MKVTATLPNGYKEFCHRHYMQLNKDYTLHTLSIQNKQLKVLQLQSVIATKGQE